MVVVEREELVNVSHHLWKRQVRQLRELSRKKNYTRSELIRDLLDFALERIAA